MPLFFLQTISVCPAWDSGFGALGEIRHIAVFLTAELEKTSHTYTPSDGLRVILIAPSDSSDLVLLSLKGINFKV